MRKKVKRVMNLEKCGVKSVEEERGLSSMAGMRTSIRGRIFLLEMAKNTNAEGCIMLDFFSYLIQ